MSAKIAYTNLIKSGNIALVEMKSMRRMTI